MASVAFMPSTSVRGPDGADHPGASGGCLAAPGMARTSGHLGPSATAWTGHGANCRRRTATGPFSPTSTRPSGYAGYTLAETKRALKRKEEPSYQGTFIECRRMASETRDLNMSLFLCRLADEVKADAREEDMK